MHNEKKGTMRLEARTVDPGASAYEPERDESDMPWEQANASLDDTVNMSVCDE